MGFLQGIREISVSEVYEPNDIFCSFRPIEWKIIRVFQRKKLLHWGFLSLEQPIRLLSQEFIEKETKDSDFEPRGKKKKGKTMEEMAERNR